MKVKIIGDDLGNVISQTENPEIGYIRIEQTSSSFSQNWVKNQKRTALIFGKHEDLTALNLKKDDEVSGKIVVQESFVPFNSKNSENELKKAGNTGVVCRVGDQPIYRRSYFTQDLNEHDVLIQHDNVDEIREAAEAMKSISISL